MMQGNCARVTSTRCNSLLIKPVAQKLGITNKHHSESVLFLNPSLAVKIPHCYYLGKEFTLPINCTKTVTWSIQMFPVYGTKGTNKLSNYGKG